jgi:hypothetical protein
MLVTDARSEIDTGLLDDPRVRQFWDEERVVGRWLADMGLGGSPGEVVWDAYLVFGPDAAWNDEPAPLRGTGAPVISAAGSLERELRPLVAGR